MLKPTKCEGEHVIEGWLCSSIARYAIRNGIPRFVSDEGYSHNFGYQWNRWAKVQFENENVGRPMEGIRPTATALRISASDKTL